MVVAGISACRFPALSFLVSCFLPLHGARDSPFKFLSDWRLWSSVGWKFRDEGSNVFFYDVHWESMMGLDEDYRERHEAAIIL